MKKLEDVIRDYKAQTIDDRDIMRLGAFLKEEDLGKLGLKVKEEFKGQHIEQDFTEENVLKCLNRDVTFGYEKAKNKRGISTCLMVDVVKMWNWILEDEFVDYCPKEEYAEDFFEAVAKKYGIELPSYL